MIRFSDCLMCYFLIVFKNLNLSRLVDRRPICRVMSDVKGKGASIASHSRRSGIYPGSGFQGINFLAN